MKNLLILFLLFFTSSLYSQWLTQTSGTINLLYSVRFIDANNGWVSGTNGTILHTTNGGTTWVSQTSGTNYDLYSVYFTDANTGYVTGGNNHGLGIILKTTNGGTNWTINWTPASVDYYFYSVQFPDANTGYAVGIYGRFLKTTNSGMNWTTQTSGIASNLQSVYFINANMGYSVAANDSGAGIILKTTNGGTNWTSQTIGTTNNGLQSIYFTDANTGYISGDGGRILKTTDGGTNWTEQTTGYVCLFSVYFPNSNSGYAVGFYGTIIKTTNGGTNWTTPNYQNPSSGTTRTLRSVYFTDANTGYAVGDSGTILKTTNGGTTGVAEEKTKMPNAFSLQQNYPNPFNPTTVISYELPSRSNVTLKVYDILGNEVAILVKEVKDAGRYSITFDGSKLSSGTYYYQLVAGGFTETKKLILIK